MVDIPTSNYSSRNGTRVIWVAIHTTEGIMDARDLGFYWQRINTASSHAGCDNVKTVTYVDPQYASWTLLNGNRRSVNMEICGWARWTRDEWLGPQRGRLVQAANWAREMCDRFGIPKRHIGAEGVARGEAGIIGHVDYTNGAHDGTHWDPGPGFPWDVFINLVNESEGGDDFLMALDGWKQERMFERIMSMAKGVPGQNFDGEQAVYEDQRHAKLEAKVDELANNVNKILEKLGVVQDPKPDPQPEPEPVYHTVVRGETLYALANKYSTTVDEIKRLSNIQSDVLSIGQRLRVK